LIAGPGALFPGRRGAASRWPWFDLVDGRAESPLETRLRLLLRDASLPPEEVQWPVTSGGRAVARLDLAWPSRRVDVEVDGNATHDDPRALYRGPIRQNELTALGRTVLRFTWADVVRSPAYVVAAVAPAIRR
jgi:very-short-patch-repair endonuclease